MSVIQDRNHHPPDPAVDGHDGPLERLGFRVESDYGTVPAKKWSQPWSPTSVRVLTAAGALIVGFLLSSGAVVGHRAAEEESLRKDQLIALVNQRQERADSLSAELDDLRAQVQTMQESVATTGAPSLQRSVDEIALATGVTAVTGPGVRVTFSDAEGICESARPEDCRIQDTDVQLGLNELWALGAEAISVNGERVVSTTAVRNAGSAILVNYRVLTSPYVVEAIGDPETLSASFLDTQLAEDFAAWQKTYRLGFSVERAAELDIEAYAGAVQLDAGVTIDTVDQDSS